MKNKTQPLLDETGALVKRRHLLATPSARASASLHASPAIFAKRRAAVAWLWLGCSGELFPQVGQESAGPERGRQVPVQNAQVEQALRTALEAQGYSLSPPHGNGETGVDVLASRGGETIYVEVIGYKASPPARFRDFFEVWFRVLSRVGKGASSCANALPIEFQRGMANRAQNYGLAWTRLTQAFPEVALWFVHTSGPGSPRYEVSQW